jgi:two-component system, NtrC family, sensor histidine kinase HydH
MRYAVSITAVRGNGALHGRICGGSPMSSRLSFQVAVPIITISFFLLLVGVGAAWYLQHLQDKTSALLVENVASMKTATEFEISLRRLQNELSEYLLSHDAIHLKALPELRKQADVALAEVDRTGTTVLEKMKVGEIQKGYKELRAAINEFEKRAPAETEVHSLSDFVSQEILSPAHEYLVLNEQLLAQRTEDNQIRTHEMASILGAIGCIGAAIGILASVDLVLRIRRSLTEVGIPLRAAAGKLSAVTGTESEIHDSDILGLEQTARSIDANIDQVVERLQQSEREVFRVEKLAAVGRLASGLAHELRNPLMAMKVLVQSTAERGPLASLNGRDLSVLDEEISRLEESLTNFLDFARPPQLEKRSFDLRDILRQTIELVSTRAEQQGVYIAKIMPEWPVTIVADSGYIRQLFLNLLLNALDAMPAGGTIRVDMVSYQGQRGALADLAVSGERLRPPQWVTVAVADTGRGLPPELGHRIFEPFVSGKDTGTGLGLSICRRIVEAHGGQITASDHPGGGAVFIVRLPVSEAVASPVAAEVASPAL